MRHLLQSLLFQLMINLSSATKPFTLWLKNYRQSYYKENCGLI